MFFSSQKSFFLPSLGCFLMASLIIAGYIFGWTTPSVSPPANNLPAVLLPSSVNQSKLGYLSIGTTTPPSFPLDVAGVIRIGRFSSAPSGSPGALYYDTTSNKFKGYTNTGWSDLGGGSLWTQSGNDIYYTAGNVGIGTSSPVAKLDILPSSIPGLEIRICYNGVCCPIWKDCDGDGYTYGNGDCDESCATCYVGSASYTFAPDSKDQDCDGIVDETTIGYLVYANNGDSACNTVCTGYSSSCVSIGTDTAGTNSQYQRLRVIPPDDVGCGIGTGDCSTLIGDCSTECDLPCTYCRCSKTAYQ